jgi:drug/metabolite transporter (DMT)-like permease
VAFFILGEAITPASLVGGAVILFGVWLVNRDEGADESTSIPKTDVP